MKKFDDDPRVAVITTKQVFKENKPILHVFHHEEDGMWEFIGHEEVKEEDYMVVSLEEIVNLDSSLLDIPDLDYGKEAYRESKDSPWIIRE